MGKAIFAIYLLGIMLLAGCAPKTGPAKFYRLEPLGAAPTPIVPSTPDRTMPVVALGPVRVPAYLDRPQIVTGGVGSRMHLDEFHRWAEPLRDMLAPVLAENLTARLSDMHWVTFPWNRAVTPDYQVEIDLFRFHVDVQNMAQLWANWTVICRNHPPVLRQSRIALPAAGRDMESLIAAQNQTLAKFAEEIAKTLQTLAGESIVYPTQR